MLQKKCLATRDLLLGVVSLLVGLAGLIGSLFLIASPIIYRTKATPQSIPKEIKLTNFSANSVSLSFVTQEPSIGGVVFATDDKLKLANTAYDDRGENTSSMLHHITLKNLKPATVYFFRLISSGQQFDNEGNPYAFSTPQLAKTVPSLPFIINGQTPKESLVYFNFPDSTAVSTITDQNGRYLLTISNALKKDLKDYYHVQKKETGFLIFTDAYNSKTQKIVVEDEIITANIAPQENMQEKPPSLNQNLPNPSPVKKSSNLIDQILLLLRKIIIDKNV